VYVGVCLSKEEQRKPEHVIISRFKIVHYQTHKDYFSWRLHNNGHLQEDLCKDKTFREYDD